ncbi:glycoside hydrolase family 2 protein [Ferruginibacter sp. HRS2-29]|uniref:glycoside hydrolase family 2 protein n=1 Tax=Ferruginibacter sp. HRS2-29 TaxID=2487334 RepID=UPI0020CF3EF4|nr:glycoside hydrolase family 2 TIM barrel-domain containing protein [Ferruginibacter sp. HRS2-29]
MILLICFCQHSLYAQKSLRLENDWQFLKQDIGGIWEAVRPVIKNNPEAVPVWTNVTLPHCANADDAVDPDGFYYQGASWYRTQISLENPYAKGRTLLHFEGAGQKTTVYIYTTEVASHVGGYDEWTVDITDAVEAFKKNPVYQKQFKGRIPVSIRTDNSRDLEMIPSTLSDFSIYGGIYRHINLVYAPPLSFDKLFVAAKVENKSRQGKLSVRARFFNPDNIGSADISVKVTDAQGKLVGQSRKKLVGLNKDAQLEEIIIEAPRLWSTENPDLYTVEAIAINGGDTCRISEQAGFRTTEFLSKGPFLLNGKRLLLRGTHRHEDHAGVAAAMTDEMIRNEMLLMKEMGANFIRLGHYQQSRYVLKLCDSLGILVWEEIPWCRGGLGGRIYKEQAKRMLTNMIEQHYSHPSAIIWGLGNENDWPGDFTSFDTSAIKRFMTELNDLSHQLDPSRKTAIRRCDFCKEIPDIYSPSIWAGWYRGVYTDYKEFTKKEFSKVNHFLHVEWGGDSHAGRHSETPDIALQQFMHNNDTANFIKSVKAAKDGDWNESYICNLVDWHLKEQEKMPRLTGTAAWTFKDFSTPIRPDNPVPYVNQKGVVERDLTKKEAFYVFQSYWASRPMVHIYGHAASIRWGKKNEKKLVKIYSNCDQAELFVNGKSAGVKKRNSQDYPAAGYHWEVAFANGENMIHVVARKGKEIVTDTIRFQYETASWGKVAKAILDKIAETDGEVTLQVKLVDDQGHQCLDAANWVRFGLTGDGKLIDNLGTSTGSRYVQVCNGVARIKIKKNNGASVASAMLEGISTVFIDIKK